MAEKLDVFPESAQRSAYPLDDWLDGSPWALVRGEDFDHSPTSMRSMLSSGAKARGMKLRTRRRMEDDQEVLIVQAYVPPQEQSQGKSARQKMSSDAREDKATAT